MTQRDKDKNAMNTGGTADAASHRVTPCHIDGAVYEQALKAARAELAGDRSRMLGALGHVKHRPQARRAVPSQWDIVHVMNRLEEAFGTLTRLPVATRPRGHANAMPAYVYDWADLLAQADREKEERAKDEQSSNQVRIRPGPAEITRMIEAFGWPMRYLGDKPEVSAAVNHGARCALFELDVKPICRRLRISKRAFFRRKMHGIRIITQGLIRDRVPVK